LAGGQPAGKPANEPKYPAQFDALLHVGAKGFFRNEHGHVNLWISSRGQDEIVHLAGDYIVVESPPPPGSVTKDRVFRAIRYESIAEIRLNDPDVVK
jgi:hypothetical protein